MPKANALKKGNVVTINNQLYIAKHIEVKTPSARGASTLYKVRYTNLQTKLKLEESYKGDDMIQDVDLERRSVQYLYQEGDVFNFMDKENYNQFALNQDALEGSEKWLAEDLDGIIALIMDGNMISLELPQSIDLEITYTEPFLKGASATSRNKPATLSNGVDVQVPEYLSIGDVVRVNTETGKFMSRA